MRIVNNKLLINQIKNINEKTSINLVIIINSIFISS